ncbi:MAG: alpha/beta hydrolase, partial [Planctomycetota bacterium]
KSGPRFYRSREEFVADMFNAGFKEGIAGWVGKNLKRTESGLVIDLDFDRIEEMLEDHHRLDLWGLLESPPCDRLEFYIGERSRVVPESSRQRIQTLVEAKPEQLSLTIVKDAGHWLHVDAPIVLLELLTSGISH